MYSCFALYLSSCVDLLPAEYCRELALTPDFAPPLPPEAVQLLLKQELGSHVERAFSEVDHFPQQSSLISQRHRARLRTGARVELVLLRPSFSALQVDRGASLLNIEAIDLPGSELLTPEIVADFETALKRKLNFTLAKEGMELMARDASSSELLRSHRTYSELCTRKVLTFALQGEQTIDEVILQRPRGKDVLARHLCQAWLEQALHGHCFPVDPQVHNIYIEEGDKIAFLHCDVVGLPGSSKENLSSYFDALLSDDPDKAAMYLLREMAPHPGKTIDGDSLRSNFRQAAYFGMLEPVLGTDSNAVAQIIFQHCRTAREHHYRPKAHLLCFYRGLFSIARIARQICPMGDPLREGFEELRATGAFDQLREIMDWRYWFQNADKFAATMMNLPRTFDSALTRASSISVDAIQPEKGSSSRDQKATSAGNIILLLVLLVVITQVPGANGWSGKLIPLALMLAGLLAFRKG